MDINAELIKIVIDGVFAIIGTIALTIVKPYIELKIRNTWIEKAVRSAEQIYRESGSGAQKKQYVVDFLISNGIMSRDADGNIPEWADIMIEAAVKELDHIVG